MSTVCSRTVVLRTRYDFTEKGIRKESMKESMQCDGASEGRIDVGMMDDCPTEPY
jgi:hypothetical protein